MKKVLQIILVAIVSLGFISKAQALTEEELINHVSASYEIAGKNVRIKDTYINQLKQILAEKELSSEDAQKIQDYFDSAKKIMQDGKVTDPTKLSKTNREELLELGRKAANLLGINVSYADGKLILVDATTGEELAPVDVKTSLIVDGKTNGSLASTGTDYTVYIAVSGLSLVALLVVGYRKLKGNA